MAYGEKGNEGEEVHVQRQPGFWLVTKSVRVCVRVRVLCVSLVSSTYHNTAGSMFNPKDRVWNIQFRIQFSGKNR